jgi:hypothetical protein
VSAAASDAGPWDRRSVRLLVGLNVVGAAMLVVAWERSSDQAALKDQYESVNLAMLGLILAAVGQVGWITAARRSVVLRQRSALRRVMAAPPGGGHAASEPQEAAGSVWVQVPGTRRGHRAQCQLVVGKAVVPLTRADVADRDVLPCEVCS